MVGYECALGGGGRGVLRGDRFVAGRRHHSPRDLAAHSTSKAPRVDNPWWEEVNPCADTSSPARQAGKTTILAALRLRGYDVVDESATDVIARNQALGHDQPPAFGYLFSLMIGLHAR